MHLSVVRLLFYELVLQKVSSERSKHNSYIVFFLGFLGLRLGDEGLPFFYAKTWYKFLASVNGLGYCKTSFESQKSLNNKFNTLSEPQQQRSDPSSARAFAFLIPLRSALKRVLSLTAGSVFFNSVHAAFVL